MWGAIVNFYEGFPRHFQMFFLKIGKLSYFEENIYTTYNATLLTLSASRDGPLCHILSTNYALWRPISIHNPNCR